ncbi:MAG TPA: methyltransferase domain-containing protein, partial [bacterium]|nr:methyltransferase domain-containing protein [bacterium]
MLRTGDDRRTAAAAKAFAGGLRCRSDAPGAPTGPPRGGLLRCAAAAMTLPDPAPESAPGGSPISGELRAAERAKWDSYYRDLPDHAVDEPTAAFHRELIAAIDELLPEGGRLLEAGCGGGNQSLALAETGRFETALLDFSPEALRYARSQYDRAGVAGTFVEGDALQPGEPAYDLVFNLGVLEHYTTAEQTEFLRGMASRSRRYVLVLVPNLACYWYWQWRMQKTVREGWPFGKEVPTVDLREAFTAAGLRYRGHCFMGEAWTESFIRSLPGCPADTVDMLLKVHRSGIVPPAARSYLFAALGEVEGGAARVPGRWTTQALGYTSSEAEAVARISDELAARIEAERSRSVLERRVAELEAARSLSEVERVAELEAARAESKRLRAENEELRQAAEAEAHRRTAAEARIGELEHKLHEVSLWATRLDDHPFEHFVKRSTMGVARAVWNVLPIGDRARTRAYNAFAELRRRRNLRHAAPESPVDPAVPAVALPEPAAADVYVFGIVDWHFRIQRPQHLARELARRGHRVFFVSPSLVDRAEPGVQVERLDPELALYQLRLHATGAPSIYMQPPTPALRMELLAGLTGWLQAAQSRRCLALVEHAFWADLADVLPNVDVVYDCMDHHEGFGGVAASLIEREQRLVAEADLVLTSSSWLEREVGSRARANVTIRNAGDFEHFARRPERVFADAQGRRVIGYFGAIAEWFDVELVAAVASANPDCLLLLIGADTVGAGARLRGLSNVQLLGERPYEELPHYLHGFDVCLLPFRVMPLTLATNPVKVYEYFAAGKPVVGTDLPEMAQFGDLARTGRDHDGFVAAVSAALADGDEQRRRDRIAFAKANTWKRRADALLAAVGEVRWPRVSV